MYLFSSNQFGHSVQGTVTSSHSLPAQSALSTHSNWTKADKVTDLNRFLAGSEKRAFRIALAAVGDNEEALDIVQDSMLKLARLYSDKSENEWRILFHRILQSRIRDWYRRQKVRKAVMGWLPQTFSEESEADPIENISIDKTQSPEDMVNQQQRMQQLDLAIKQLPTRQREAFFMRCWEGMSTAETAESMRISEGSVKTHYSRALHALRAALSDEPNSKVEL